MINSNLDNLQHPISNLTKPVRHILIENTFVAPFPTLNHAHKIGGNSTQRPDLMMIRLHVWELWQGPMNVPNLRLYSPCQFHSQEQTDGVEETPYQFGFRGDSGVIGVLQLLVLFGKVLDVSDGRDHGSSSWVQTFLFVESKSAPE